MARRRIVHKKLLPLMVVMLMVAAIPTSSLSEEGGLGLSQKEKEFCEHVDYRGLGETSDHVDAAWTAGVSDMIARDDYVGAMEFLGEHNPSRTNPFDLAFEYALVSLKKQSVIGRHQHSIRNEVKSLFRRDPDAAILEALTDHYYGSKVQLRHGNTLKEMSASSVSAYMVSAKIMSALGCCDQGRDYLARAKLKYIAERYPERQSIVSELASSLGLNKLDEKKVDRIRDAIAGCNTDVTDGASIAR